MFLLHISLGEKLPEGNLTHLPSSVLFSPYSKPCLLSEWLQLPLNWSVVSIHTLYNGQNGPSKMYIRWCSASSQNHPVVSLNSIKSSLPRPTALSFGSFPPLLLHHLLFPLVLRFSCYQLYLPSPTVLLKPLCRIPPHQLSIFTVAGFTSYSWIIGREPLPHCPPHPFQFVYNHTHLHVVTSASTSWKSTSCPVGCHSKLQTSLWESYQDPPTTHFAVTFRPIMISLGSTPVIERCEIPWLSLSGFIHLHL